MQKNNYFLLFFFFNVDPSRKFLSEWTWNVSHFVAHADLLTGIKSLQKKNTGMTATDVPAWLKSKVVAHLNEKKLVQILNLFFSNQCFRWMRKKMQTKRKKRTPSSTSLALMGMSCWRVPCTSGTIQPSSALCPKKRTWVMVCLRSF